MQTRSPSTPTQNSGVAVNNSPFGCLARVYWVLVGNVVLLFSASKILLSGSDAPSSSYFVYLAGVLALALFRYVDIKYFSGQTTSGAPASMRDWRSYTVRLLLISLSILGLVHAIAHFWQR